MGVGGGYSIIKGVTRVQAVVSSRQLRFVSARSVSVIGGSTSVYSFLDVVWISRLIPWTDMSYIRFNLDALMQVVTLFPDPTTSTFPRAFHHSTISKSSPFSSHPVIIKLIPFHISNVEVVTVYT